ncbi:protein FAM219B isoform X1 [Canis lupus dingo]|uniref:protein FAM219B isoform X1 n=1 Tax=Canis lupus dingo TaxID=286419 RepID=UPI000DC6CD6F|nr:protein FAM219B isoform X1 [Canis lupus dingo]
MCLRHTVLLPCRPRGPGCRCGARGPVSLRRPPRAAPRGPAAPSPALGGPPGPGLPFAAAPCAPSGRRKAGAGSAPARHRPSREGRLHAGAGSAAAAAAEGTRRRRAGPSMASADRGGPGPRPGGTAGGAAGAPGPPSGRSGGGGARAAVEKRGPYMVTRAPSLPAKLPKPRDLARAVLRRKGVQGAPPPRPGSSAKRSVKFNKGYTALSQSPDENLVSLDSDSDGELESRYSSGYSSAEQVNQDVSRQLLQDGYHLDEIPDDEDLDLIPPKPMASSTCSCCWCCPGDSSSCTLQ